MPLQITEDAPGDRLRLQTTSKPAPSVRARAGCLGVFLAVVAIAVATLYAFDASFPAYGAVGLFALFLGLLPMAVAFPTKEVLAFTVDRQAGQVRLRHGLAGYHVPEQVVDGADIDVATLTVPPGVPRDGQRSAIPLTLLLEDHPHGKRLLRRELAVAGIDSDREIADFAVRLGSALGLGFRRTVQCDPQRLELRLTRQREAGAEPLGPVAAAADYAEDVVSAGVEAPEEVTHFDPRSPLPASLRITSWLPPRQVRLAQGGSGGQRLLLVACAATILTALALPLALDVLPQAASLAPYSPHIAVAAFLIAAASFLISGHSRVHFDIAGGQVEVRLAGRRRVVRAAEIAEVVLQDSTWGGGRDPDGGHRRSHYAHRLELQLQDGSRVQLTSGLGSGHLDPWQAQFGPLYGLAAALGKELGVPHRYDDDPLNAR